VSAASGQRLSGLRAWITNALLICIGSVLFLLTRQLVREFDGYSVGYEAIAGWSLVCYALAISIVLTQPVNRYSFGIILSFAIGFRLVTLFPAPHLSSDIYRYAWDGVVQHAHISPYRYVPGDPALQFLHQPNQELFDHMNRRDYAHTIYPPVAQMIFYGTTFISPTMTFMKAAMILFEGLTMYALVLLLKEMGFRREQALLYAWCPLLVWEIGSSGHVDSAVMAFVALALLFRYRRQPVLTGLFLGLAVMTKFYPLVLFPALYRRGDYKMPVTVASVIAVGYACYASVGLGVFGFLGGYVHEEGMDTGQRYFLQELSQRLPGLHIQSTAPYLVFVAAVFVVLMIWCWQTCCSATWESVERGQTRFFGLPTEAGYLLSAFALAGALMLLFSPHYPWYLAWLVPFFTLVPTLSALSYFGGLFFMSSTSLAVGFGPKQFLLNKILYSVVIAAMALDFAFRRWPLKWFKARLASGDIHS